MKPKYIYLSITFLLLVTIIILMIVLDSMNTKKGMYQYLEEKYPEGEFNIVGISKGLYYDYTARAVSLEDNIEFEIFKHNEVMMDGYSVVKAQHIINDTLASIIVRNHLADRVSKITWDSGIFSDTDRIKDYHHSNIGINDVRSIDTIRLVDNESPYEYANDIMSIIYVLNENLPNLENVRFTFLNDQTTFFVTTSVHAVLDSTVEEIKKRVEEAVNNREIIIWIL